jgi:ABC-type multidrug transport system fused ATPase/permease subunit
MYYGATMVDSGVMEVGDMFAVFGFTMFGCFGIIILQATLQGEEKAISAGARILKLTTHTPDLPFEGGDELDPFKGHIAFRNVSFKYPTRDVYVLKNVSFEIKPGQIGALVGHSGSGKSTCVQLLERYYDVTEGVIEIDGHDIRSLNPRWLHRKTGLVSQEPVLFGTSIRQNILYGNMEATEEQMLAAAEIANCKRFTENLGKGFETLVGEKGSTLSGGQRQRVAIARAVIKDPVILITDEATSALDAGSEKKVQKALDKVMENRTAVIVAHRLSTIKNAHVIYVFDSGEIQESGTHDELVAVHGCYYNLVSRQLNEADSKPAASETAQSEDDEDPD